MTPFVKWVGGKRRLIPTIIEYMPKEFNTYYEPFLGGGALLFALEPKKAIVNDFNADLINTYNVIANREKMNLMCKELDKHEKNHCEKYFYDIRALDRNKETFNKLEDYFKASRFIYLNKSCFNGKYQVNKKNEFNSSFNKQKKVNTYNKENIENIHNYLCNNDVTILCEDFEKSLINAKENDFVYLDPPYDNIKQVFNKYTANGFNKNEQVRVSIVFKELDKRGCYVMLSNYDTPLIRELYKNYNIYKIESCTNINGFKKKKNYL